MVSIGNKKISQKTNKTRRGRHLKWKNPPDDDDWQSSKRVKKKLHTGNPNHKKEVQVERTACFEKS